jgi:hypothetical protein
VVIVVVVVVVVVVIVVEDGLVLVLVLVLVVGEVRFVVAVVVAIPSLSVHLVRVSTCHRALRTSLYFDGGIFLKVGTCYYDYTFE